MGRVKAKPTAAAQQSPPFGVFDRISSLSDEYSKSERRIVDYLLNNPHEFARSNVKEVAEATSVSEPTVVRFCRRVGCAGFKELKLQIVEELAYRQALKEGIGDVAAAPKSGSRRGGEPIAQEICSAAVSALQSSMKRVDWSAVDKAAQSVAGARRVVIYGIGGSSAVLAQELHNRLFRLDINCCPFVDSYLQRMVAATLSDQDVAFFVTSTGRPRALLDSIELAQHYGAMCIGVAPAQSPVGRSLDICVDLELTQGGVSPLHPNPMRYGQLFLIDCVAYAVAVRLGPRAETVLKRARASVSALHGVAPLQPIGD